MKSSTMFLATMVGLMILVSVSGCGGSKDTPTPEVNNPIKISNGIATSTNPSVSKDGNNVISVWEQSGEIMFATSTNGGGSFSTSTSVLVGGSNPVVAISGDKIIIACERNREIEMIYSVDGGKVFSTSTNISNSIDDAFNPSVAMDGGKVVIVWREGRQIMFARSINGGLNFGSPVKISDSLTGVFDPSVAMDGNIVGVVWEGEGQIWFSRSNDSGASFSPVVKISNSLDGGGINPAIAINGNIVGVVWEEAGQIKFTRSTDGVGNFSTPFSISDSEAVTFNPVIMMTGTTTVLVAWGEGDGVINSINFSRSTDGVGNFSAPATISDNINLFSGISLAGDVVVWSGGSDIWLQRLQ